MKTSISSEGTERSAEGTVPDNSLVEVLVGDGAEGAAVAVAREYDHLEQLRGDGVGRHRHGVRGLAVPAVRGAHKRSNSRKKKKNTVGTAPDHLSKEVMGQKKKLQAVFKKR